MKILHCWLRDLENDQTLWNPVTVLADLGEFAAVSKADIVSIEQNITNVQKPRRSLLHRARHKVKKRATQLLRKIRKNKKTSWFPNFVCFQQLPDGSGQKSEFLWWKQKRVLFVSSMYSMERGGEGFLSLKESWWRNAFNRLFCSEVNLLYSEYPLWDLNGLPLFLLPMPFLVCQRAFHYHTGLSVSERGSRKFREIRNKNRKRPVTQ